MTEVVACPGYIRLPRLRLDVEENGAEPEPQRAQGAGDESERRDRIRPRLGSAVARRVSSMPEVPLETTEALTSPINLATASANALSIGPELVNQPLRSIAS